MITFYIIASELAKITGHNTFDVKKLGEDILEMEKMLNEYLQFTSSSYLEKDEKFNLSELLNEIIDKYNNKKIRKNLISEIFINGRKNLISRCINNLLDNSVKYAKKISVNLEKKKSTIFLSIDDDGPGVDKSEFNNITKPFYKIDKSRSESKSSVGLGLSISSDTIKSHGGDIHFNKSKLGGLKVTISLPY